MGISFAGGLAAALNGWSEAQDSNYKRARQQKEDAWVEENRAAEREQRAEQKRKNEEAKAEEADLKQAMQANQVRSVQSVPIGDQDPAKVAEAMSFGEYSTPEATPPKQTYQVGQKEYATMPEARNASFEGGLQAASDYYMGKGKFEKAAPIESAISQRREIAKKLKAEGVFETAKAALTGDPLQFMKAFNASGEEVIVEAPKVVAKKANRPGFGEETTYDYTFTTKDAAGNTSTKTINSGQLNESLMPYEKLLEVKMKAAENVSQAQQRESQIKIANAHLGIQQRDEARKKQLFDAEARIPAGVKLVFAQYTKEADSIDDALNKAMAGDTYNQNSPGVQALFTQRATLGQKMDALISPYIGGREADVVSVLQKARTAGDLATAIQDLQSRGISAAKIQQLVAKTK